MPDENENFDIPKPKIGMSESENLMYIMGGAKKNIR